MDSPDDQPVLKWRPEDFVVQEAAATRIDPAGDSAYRYLRLRKRGYTTFDAVAQVALFAGIDRMAVSYAGLKDEDAVTDQQICVHLPERRYPVADFNDTHRGEENYIHLVESGIGDGPLKIGRLEGNSFRIVIRNLDAGLAEAISGRRHNHLFFNYYDTQRFGVPGGPRVTHRIGSHLLNQDYVSAIALIAASGASESEAAKGWEGDPAAFFSRLDPRLRSFYLSAYASDTWNTRLGDLVDRHGTSIIQVRDGITYRFAKTRETAAAVAVHAFELEYTKYRADDSHEVVPLLSTRSTVTQTQVVAGPAAPDMAYPGKHCCEITMFLPSGSYATTAIAQLLLMGHGDAPALSGAVPVSRTPLAEP